VGGGGGGAGNRRFHKIPVSKLADPMSQLSVFAHVTWVLLFRLLVIRVVCLLSFLLALLYPVPHFSTNVTRLGVSCLFHVRMFRPNDLVPLLDRPLSRHFSSFFAMMPV
jgi:hypothetical protein